MKQLAIRGDKQRGAEVIALLGMLGGYNMRKYTGDSKNAYYYLTSCNYIDFDDLPCDEDDNKLYTLDEFWADFPYKVGDKVMIELLDAETEVKKMRWDEDKERIEYECRFISNGGLITAIAEDLIPIEAEPAEDNAENEPINIAEILKDAPKGTKLYSLNYGNVKLKRITEYSIVCCNEDGYEPCFEYNGKYNINGECLLFPSKDNRDWSTFKVEPQFPTDANDCGNILGFNRLQDASDYRREELDALRELLICRDAWWKADNDWKPDLNNPECQYIIRVANGGVIKDYNRFHQDILAFRTKEIRDKFLETFRYLIEQCKELI